jgi:hypothetical protein
MNTIILKWLVNLALGISFFVCFITGLLKYTVLLQVTGLSNVVLPSAFISELHDWSGIVLGLLVFLHLYLNRRWIITMTREILANTPKDP